MNVFVSGMGHTGEYIAKNPNFWPPTKKKTKKRSHLLIFGPKGEEILGPNLRFLGPYPLLNGKLIRFGPLCQENPVFHYFIFYFFLK